MTMHDVPAADGAGEDAPTADESAAVWAPADGDPVPVVPAIPVVPAGAPGPAAAPVPPVPAAAAGTDLFDLDDGIEDRP